MEYEVDHSVIGDDRHSISVYVTKEGKLGINVNGRIVLGWPKEWWFLGVESSSICLRQIRDRLRKEGRLNDET